MLHQLRYGLMNEQEAPSQLNKSVHEQTISYFLSMTVSVSPSAKLMTPGAGLFARIVLMSVGFIEVSSLVRERNLGLSSGS